MVDSKIQDKEQKKKKKSKKDENTTYSRKQVQSLESSSSSSSKKGRAQIMLDVLKEHGCLLLAKLVANPQSYTQTVENMFDLSVLVSSNRVCIFNENNCMYVRFVSSDDHGQPNQCITRFNYDMFQEMLQKYKLKDEMPLLRR